MIVDSTLSAAWFRRDTRPFVEDPDAFEHSGVRIIDVTFPRLSAGFWWRRYNREIILEVRAEDYSYLPVQGWWVEENGSLLQPGHGLVPNGDGFHADGHPQGLLRSWLCFQGWRDFHDHISHQNVSWASIRHQPRYRITALVMQLFTDLQHPGVNAR